MILLALLAQAITPFAAAPAPTGPAWSSVSDGLAGRLLDRSSLEHSGSIALVLELRSVEGVPIAVEADNPLALTIRVVDERGAEVPPTFWRGDLFVTPGLAVIPPYGYVGYPATRGTPGLELDFGPRLWRLPAGTYQVLAEYSASGFRWNQRPAADVRVWKGRLTLPPVVVEVRP